jgi:glycosyltransferase involved in cell wall biosynthesis
MKALVVALYYDHPTEIGGVRPRSFIKTFKENNIDADVLCGKFKDLSFFHEEHLSVSVIDNPLRKLRGLFKRKSSDTAEKTDIEIDKNRVGYLRRVYYSFNHLMLGYKTWALFACIKLLLLRLKGRKYDIVITSSPPFSLNLIGRLASIVFNAKWICDLRDPLIDINRLNSDVDSWLRKVIENWSNQMTLKNADIILLTSNNLKDKYSKLYPQYSNKFLVVMNGIDKIYYPSNSHTLSSKKIIKILYAGCFYLHRDPRDLIEAIAQFNLENSEKSAIFEVYSDLQSFSSFNIDRWCKENGYDKFCQFNGLISRKQLHSKYLEADILVIFAKNQKLAIPGKVFEYLAYFKPIILIAEPDSEVGNLAIQYNFATPVESKDEILKQIYEISNYNNSTKRNKNLKELERETQNMKLVNLIKQIS